MERANFKRYFALIRFEKRRLGDVSSSPDDLLCRPINAYDTTGYFARRPPRHLLDVAQGRDSVARAAQRRHQCLIRIEAAVLDRLRAVRRPGEDYSDVLRLVKLETQDSS